MNAERRKRITNIIDKLGEIHEELETVSIDEQDAYDNMPENLQGSIRGERSYEVAGELDNCADDIQDIINRLQDSIE